jgi:periplasmic divalent cation tolerance protein
MTEYSVVLITVPDKEQARKIASGLVGEHLAACVNVIPGIESVYRWQGEIHTDTELLLMCKTEASQWDKLCAWVKANHPYDVPEIVRVPIVEGSGDYLNWITACLEK